MNQADQLRSQVAELQAAILSAHPALPTLLQHIHRQLKSDPENVTILSEEEIGIIVGGLKQQTATTISTSMATKKTGKAVSKLGIADL